MALMKYSELLGMAKDKLKEVMAPIRAHEMLKKAELEMAKLDGAIAEHEENIQSCASQYPIDFDDLLQAIDYLELTKRKKEQFEKIIAELFPSETKKHK